VAPCLQVGELVAIPIAPHRVKSSCSIDLGFPERTGCTRPIAFAVRMPPGLQLSEREAGRLTDPSYRFDHFAEAIPGGLVLWELWAPKSES
jgi:hypothetical protein